MKWWKDFQSVRGCFTGKYPMEPPKEDIRGEYYDKEIDLERKMSR